MATRVAVKDKANIETRNKHQLRTEETKRKLLDASCRVFTRDGFEAARIEDIATEAGFTRGAFYAHFSTKGDLFIALLEQEAERVREKFKQIVARSQAAEERTSAFRSFYISRASDRQWAILLLEFKLFALRHPDLHQALSQAHRMVRATFSQWLLETFMQDLECTEQDYDVMRATLESSLAGLVLERAYDPKRLSDAQVKGVLGQIFDCVTSRPFID